MKVNVFTFTLYFCNHQSLINLFLIFKAFIELSCKTINEIRFYFEFHQLSKHLSSTNSSTTAATATLPIITHNLDFKSSQMLGSIKLIYLLVPSVAAVIQQPNEDLVNLVKFKIELKNFFTEISEYLRSQLNEMNVFILSYSNGHQSQTNTVQEDNQMNENQNEDSLNTLKHRNEKIRKPEDAKPKRKKVKLDINEATDETPVLVDDDDDDEDEEDDDEEEDDSEENNEGRLSKTTGKSAQLNSALVITILKQVDLKRKCLDHIIQVLNQTLNYLTTSLSLTDSKENDKVSSRSSSRASSPQTEVELEEKKIVSDLTETQ